MAILRAPLMSFDARGQLANSLVFMGWKGLKTVREKVIPSNPQSAAQTTQRNFFTVAVDTWRNFIRNAETQVSWNQLALLQPRPLSGFNSFMSAALELSKTDPNSSFAIDFVTSSSANVEVNMVNLNDGSSGDESGLFTLNVGTRADSLLFQSTQAIGGGSMIFQLFGFELQTVFCEIVKDGQSRSGIFKVTIEA